MQSSFSDSRIPVGQRVLKNAVRKQQSIQRLEKEPNPLLILRLPDNGRIIHAFLLLFFRGGTDSRQVQQALSAV